MKVIAISNFDNDTVSDRLIAENLSEEEAKKLAAEKNAKCGKYSTYYYQAVADNHKLYIWEP